MNLADIRKRQIQYYAYVVMAIIFLMLGKTIGNNGLAYVAVAIETISVFMIFIGDTIADTYAKMIRIRRKRKLHHDVIAIRKRVFFIQIILGMFLFISVLLFIIVVLIAILFATLQLLHTHSLMDWEFDKKSNRKTSVA